MASRATGRTARPRKASGPAAERPSSKLTIDQKLELYYYMRMTRALEERLVNLYRQTKVVGGLFRSLGQEADAVGSAYALDRSAGDFLSPLIRNLGSMLVQGAQPTEIIRQYMAKGDSPTRGRELNIHFGDLKRGFIGQISHLGDMVPVMTGVTLSFKLRGEPRVGLVYVGDGATSTGAFHEGINFAAVQRCPLVVIVENNGWAYSTPISKQTASRRFVDKALAYGIPGVQADGNDVLAVYDATKAAVDRARKGEGVTLVELLTYRRKGHAEHDNQSYIPEGELERWAAENDPVDRYVQYLMEGENVTAATLADVDRRVLGEIDAATDLADASPMPEPTDSLTEVYAGSGSVEPLWFREGVRSAVAQHERAAGWGTFSG
ncbi:MAG: thiamine pyrophosphate-dependent dehydrogenase E1 component subunit alpha [Gemmatimonadaceae bacterium]|nr:thiamine pyrophosphate-dependent dehydrogenase E1 component subunit alpha [Gemmatimonadaceae bacterium]MDQ3517027.1 thiamine pyrophosphate-dependent dehydrogenase E1 component subunit alpha [Gemmatimonadota bacterium]